MVACKFVCVCDCFFARLNVHVCLFGCLFVCVLFVRLCVCAVLFGCLIVHLFWCFVGALFVCLCVCSFVVLCAWLPACVVVC